MKAINNFEEQLLERGYTFFKDHLKDSIKGIQKRFTDDLGTKYFITGYHYNHAKQLERDDILSKDSYTFTAQFRMDKSDKDKTIDINFSAEFLPNKYKEISTIEEVEEFFEYMWKSCKANYYEKY